MAWCIPRAYGCFPRMIGRLRRRHNIPLELMVQRLSQNAALRFGLKDRGEIAEGKFADIVVFDPRPDYRPRDFRRS